MWFSLLQNIITANFVLAFSLFQHQNTFNCFGGKQLHMLNMTNCCPHTSGLCHCCILCLQVLTFSMFSSFHFHFPCHHTLSSSHLSFSFVTIFVIILIIVHVFLCSFSSHPPFSPDFLELPHCCTMHAFSTIVICLFVVCIQCHCAMDHCHWFLHQNMLKTQMFTVHKSVKCVKSPKFPSPWHH